MDSRSGFCQKEGFIKTTSFVLIFLFFVGSPCFALDYLELLGMVPSQTVQVLGSPLEVGVVDVKNEPSLVYFLYEDYTYTLFYSNRVWGVRFDSRFRDSVLGVKIGYSKEEAGRILAQQLGEAKITSDGSVVYNLPYQGFVAEVRTFFEGDKLKEIYLYRSDY